MAKVYGVNLSPYVRKVRVVLAEKKIPYELDPVIPVNVSPEYKAISPLGKIPAFEDGGRHLPDSSVICAYLEKKHPNPALYPSDPYEYGRALWFEEYADTALAAEIGPKIFFQKLIGPIFFNQKTDEAMVEKAVNEGLPPLFDYLEGQIGGDWLAGGAFSIADISVGSQFANLRHAGYGADAARWPKLAKYLARVHARPSLQALIDEEAAGLPKAA